MHMKAAESDVFASAQGQEGSPKNLQQFCECQHERAEVHGRDGVGFSSSTARWQIKMIKCNLCVFLENNSLRSKRRHFQMHVLKIKLSGFGDVITCTSFIAN